MVIEVERAEDTLRAFDEGKTGKNLDPFKAIGTVRYYGETAIIDKLKGCLSHKDIMDSYRACKDAGAKWVLAHRKEGHTIPMGELVPHGQPFGGWWRVDLSGVK